MVIASSQTHFNPAATAAAGGRLDDFQPTAFMLLFFVVMLATCGPIPTANAVPLK
jgi:hypothetical protein